MGITLRRLGASDSLEELTALLHAAYGALAAEGLHYYASHQPTEVTKSRADEGECWVAVDGDRVIGTITLVPPGRPSDVDWYARDGVAHFSQFAVSPDCQGRGIGALLMDHAERRAGELGAREIALDTSELAARLIATYERRGYRKVAEADWRPTVNYRSVVLSKTL